jgi:hypothetical protein
MLRMKDTDRFSLAAMRSGDAPASASALNVSRSAGVQSACLAILRFIRHEIGDDARALPNLNIESVLKLASLRDRCLIVGRVAVDRRSGNVAVFADRIKTICWHRSHPKRMRFQHLKKFQAESQSVGNRTGP